MHSPGSDDLFDPPRWTPVPASSRLQRPVYDDLGPRPVRMVDAPPVEVDDVPELDLDEDPVEAPVETLADDEPSLEGRPPEVPVEIPAAHRVALEAWDADSTLDQPVPRGTLGPILVVLLGGTGLLVATAAVLAALIAGGVGLAVYASARSTEAVAVVAPAAAPAPIAAPIVEEPAPAPVAPKPVAKAAPKAAPKAPAKVVVREAAPVAPAGVRVAAEGASVALVADGARYVLPAIVPAGRYQVEATFDDGVPVIVDKVTVGDDPVMVRCNPRMGICRGQ